MVRVNCGRINLIMELLDEKEINGVIFHCQSQQGIQATFSHNGTSEEAKKVLKSFFKSNAKTKSLFIGIEQIES